MSAVAPAFEFSTVAYLTRIGNQSATTLAEFLSGLEECSDASIFHHTYQTLGSHHFLTEKFSNDFAQWVQADANRNDLAEQLASLDIRDYTSIAALRNDLCRIVGDYCNTNPKLANQSALKQFFFCESMEVTFALGFSASTLDEFRAGIQDLSHSSFFFHFISSRLRLQLQTNDFSYWLTNTLGLNTLAANVNRIDIYTNTLESVRAKLLRLIDFERRKA
jgi:Family of unknown function (DUF5752)